MTNTPQRINRKSPTSQPSRAPRENRLLAALPRRDRQHLLADCEGVDLVFNELLCMPGERIRHVLFPREGFISLLASAGKNASLEVALIGDEGMLGASLLLGVKIAPLKGQVQGEGRAWRMTTSSFLSEVKRSTALSQSLNQYLYVRFAQLAQTAACTRFHLLEARLARWLLMTRDRAHANAFPITQEFLAAMLGVRRVGVTQAANSLQQRGLIRYNRGKLRILGERGLEATACGCYAIDKETYRSIML